MQKYVIINKFFLLILVNFVFYNNKVFAQNIDTHNLKIELKKLGDKIINSNDIENKLLITKSFKETLTSLLKKENSYKLDLSNIPPLYIVTSPDKKFRIISWSNKIHENKWQYYSILQFNRKSAKYIELSNFANPPKDDNDLSCIYYDIILSSKKDKQYILLGWKKKNNSINAKIIEPLNLNNNQLGAPIFNNYGPNTYRLIFNYPNNSALVLNYQKNKKRIIIEHLSQQENGLYMPDGSYDALTFNGSTWSLINNVNP